MEKGEKRKMALTLDRPVYRLSAMSTAPSNDGPAGTRERLIGAMIRALRTRGFHGVGLTELLAQARAPKGVLYHHFPGGKAELAVAAIDEVVGLINAELGGLFQTHRSPEQALTAWLSSAQRTLMASGFEHGCPLATVALESTASDLAIRAALAKGFSQIRETLLNALLFADVEPARAKGLSALMVSAFEGALLQARVAGDVEPIRQTAGALREVLAHSLPRLTPEQQDHP